MTYRTIAGMLTAVGVLLQSPAFAGNGQSFEEGASAGPEPGLTALATSAAEAPQVAQATGATANDGAVAYVGGSDHSRMVGTFGVGYLGQAGLTTIDGSGDEVAVDVPVIGVRYWFNNRMGLDAGLGFATGGTTTTVGPTETEAPDPFAMAIRAGVPFALMDSRHFVFQVVPELGFGFSSNTIDAGGGDDTEVSSTHFDIGARVGAEIHFGFIDIPQLALQAGVGLRFSADGGSAEQGGDELASFSSTRLATTVGSDPWSIFTGGVAALYYFGR